MSYNPKEKTDSLNEYFSRLIDFYNISPRLLNARSDFEFEIWLEKLELIDRRTLFLFLRKHKEEIPKKYLKEAQRRFIEEI